MTYRMLKTLITRGTYDREDTIKKMDVFLLFERISNEEYTELIELMG